MGGVRRRRHARRVAVVLVGCLLGVTGVGSAVVAAASVHDRAPVHVQEGAPCALEVDLAHPEQSVALGDGTVEVGYPFVVRIAPGSVAAQGDKRVGIWLDVLPAHEGIYAEVAPSWFRVDPSDRPTATGRLRVFVDPGAWRGAHDVTVRARCGDGAEAFATARLPVTPPTGQRQSVPWPDEGGLVVRAVPGGELTPGATVPLDVTLENPTSRAVRLTSLEVSVDHVDTAHADCDPHDRFVVVPFSGDYERLQVPAGGRLSLSGAGVPVQDRPQLTVLDDRAARAACSGAVPSFSYRATLVQGAGSRSAAS